MFRSQGAYFRRLTSVALTIFLGIGLAATFLVLGQVYQVQAQGITVDGNGSDWYPAWVVIVDPYDAISSSDPTTATRFASMHARSGYEVLSFSVHYDSNTWYFKLDIDGRPGDSDSISGTAEVPGVGTTGNDNGPLGTPGSDLSGLGFGEAYRILFELNTDGMIEQGLSLFNVPSANTVYSTTREYGTTIGNAAYSDAYTPTGIVEFEIAKSQLLPVGPCLGVLSVRAQGGSNYDNVADDAVPSAVDFLSLLNFTISSRAITVTGSNVVTYSIPYTITGNAATPAHNAYITQTLDANSYFDTCGGGASCFHGGSTPGGMITWNLTTPITPGTASATGIVTAVIRTASLADQTALARLGADEGLCAQSSITFTPTTPTLVSLSELRAESVGLLSRFWWAALALMAAALLLFATRRKVHRAAQA